MGRSRKPVYPQGYRGFKSLPLRQARQVQAFSFVSPPSTPRLVDMVPKELNPSEVSFLLDGLGFWAKGVKQDVFSIS